jgi:hypothetical protein
MAFDPIAGSAYDLTADWGDAPFVVPAGYHQHKVSDERDLDIYPAVDDLGDLSSGQLYALKVIGVDPNYPVGDRTGPFEWVALDMALVVVDAFDAAQAVAATEYGRPEDVELIGHTLFVNIQHAEAELRDGTWMITHRDMQ